MRRIALAAFLASTLAAPMALAGDEPASSIVKPPAPRAQPAKDASTSDLDRIICKQREATGSRLPMAKQCLTKREWEEVAAQNRAQLERAQANRPLESH